MPKKVTTLTSKEQLKAMVSDLESEIGEILVALKNSESAKVKLEEDLKFNKKTNGSKSDLEKTLKELDEMKKKLSVMEKELAEEKSSSAKEKVNLKI